MDNEPALFLAPEAQRVMDSLARLFDVRVTICSLSIKGLFSGFYQENAPFCSLVRKKLIFNCLKQDKIMGEKYSKQTSPVFYQCFAGPTEMVMPLVLENKPAGYAMFGQFRMQKDLPDESLTHLKKAGIDAERAKTLFMKLPFFDKATVDNLLALFGAMVKYIVSARLINERRLPLIEDIMRYIEENITDNITLLSAAKTLHRSGSSIYHSVKHNLGFSFKQLCTLKRIECFEKLIAQGAVSIKEAAAGAGYYDQLYFSRVYKKVRGIKPSEFASIAGG